MTMYIIFLILTILFGAALVAGFIWFLLASGRTTRRSGPEVGAEVMFDTLDQDSDQEGQIPLAEKTWFRGTGASAHSEAGISYAEIRSQIQKGNLRQVLPALVLIAGVIGTAFFLGLTLLAGGADLIFSLVFIGFALYAAYLVISGMLRAG